MAVPSLLLVATAINPGRGIFGVILPEPTGMGGLTRGVILDRFGARIGYAVAAVLWSAAATLNGFAGSPGLR
jgi:hypothetical protein